MKKIYFPGGLLVLVLCMIGLPANAALFQVDTTFTASAFQAYWPFSTLPPDDSVSGSYAFLYDDSGINGSGFEFLEFLDVSSFSLTIDNYVYTTSELQASVQFYDGSPFQFHIFGVSNGASFSPGTNDIIIYNVVDPLPALPSSASYVGTTFIYSAASVSNTGFYAGNITENVVITSAVPIPAAAWLFCYGLIGLIGAARYKKTA